jgi:anti-sigma factor RsiW
MRCKELVEVVTEYLEGTLPAEDRARFEAHLRRCGPCRRYLEQVRVTVAALGRLASRSLAAADRDRLLTLFRDWKSGQPGPP